MKRKRAKKKPSRKPQSNQVTRRLLAMLPGPIVAAFIFITALASDSRQAFLFSPSLWLPNPQRAAVPVSPELLDGAVHRAAEYLNRSSQPDGQFEYRVNLNPRVSLKPQYNFLRHAGSIYALATYHQQYPSEKTRLTLNRSVRYLTDHIDRMPESPEMLAVWSYPVITGTDSPVQAKLGGSGLALIAIRSAEDAGADTIPLEQLRGLGRFLLYMQKQDGSFYSKYIPSQGGRSDLWTSLYYPGEAALGLLMLYERDPQPKWLQAAADTIGYLVRQRAGRKNVEADHWAVLATARLLPYYQRCRQPVPRDAVIQHAMQICESILNQQFDVPLASTVHGALAIDGRTCPTATRLEALLAARTILPVAEVTLRSHIEVTVDRGIAFLIRAQVASGPYAGGMPRALEPLSVRHPLYDRNFNQRASEVRIDYAQHALSAMLSYQKWRFVSAPDKTSESS